MPAFRRLLSAALAGLFALPASGEEGGMLRAFERDATTRPEAPAPAPASAGTPAARPITATAAPKPVARQGSTVRSGSPASQADAGDGSSELLFAMLVTQTLIEGGRQSWLRVSADARTATMTPREPGDALLVKARADLAAQHVDQRTTSLDLRVEAGYGPWAVQGRRTRFREDLPGATNATAELEVRQAHFLYRMAAGDYAELGLGYGRMQIVGLASHSGESVTVPLLIHPSPYWGFEYRPSWAIINGNTLRDQEFALLLGLPFASLRAGYRRLESSVGKDGQRLAGPFVGVSLRY